jgi:biopolymer transport protein ExbB/TolQ
VSNAVQEMIQVAERSGGIGEQIRTIAQAQNQNQIKLEESIEKVQKRSNLVKFIAGPDYREISNAEKILEQNREQIQQINQIKMQLENSADQQVLTEQVQLLEVANLEIENVLNNSQKEFSLLGWMFKLFKN